MSVCRFLLFFFFFFSSRRRHTRLQGDWSSDVCSSNLIPAPDALLKLAQGLVIQERQTLPCRAWLLDPQPDIPPRDPPIRFRKTVPACWIGLELAEGKNRQVRRMTAAIGHPTLRLIRVRIGNLEPLGLPPGTWRVLTPAERKLLLH